MTPWTGRWRVEGAMPDGGAYRGQIAIEARGGGFVLKWDIDDGVYFGFGAEAAGRLFVSCSPFERGIVLATRQDGATTLWREGRRQPGFIAMPHVGGFGVGPVMIDGAAVEAQYFGGVAAAFGADLARHVLLVYEAHRPQGLKCRWILGRETREGTERLERIEASLTPPE
jgi:hypothetical protein